MGTLLRVGTAVVLLVMALSCWGQGARVVELRAGLDSGELWAQLHGAGDSQVAGVIGRTGNDPIIAQLDPGTLYQPLVGGLQGQLGGLGGGGLQGQQGGRQQAQGGGRQGQLGLSSLTVDLTTTAVAQVVIPSACTNLGVPEPTPQDVMVPTVCPDVRLVQLANLPQAQSAPHAAVQLAVWAITDNPRPPRMKEYLRKMAAQGTRDGLAGMARELLAACALDPRGFRMFK